MSDADAFRLPAAEVPAPGTMKRIIAFDERILVANTGETLYAVSDTCTHEDASLSNGALKGDTVACPLHGSRFCLRTGAALDEPAEIPLTVYTVEADRDGVWIRPSRPVDR
jgi:3-phenylpropionate/trans-cinnamate dioxygenase ferredoxin subunit